jgi:hypothetical protein
VKVDGNGAAWSQNSSEKKTHNPRQSYTYG